MLVPTAAPLQSNAVGIGLRPAHYSALEAGDVRGIDFVEVIAENYLGHAPLPKRHLRQIAAHYPVSVHGVSLNLLGSAEPEVRHVEALGALARSVGAPFVSEHLCWTGHAGLAHHDLLPTPYTEEIVEFAVERVRWVQQTLGIPFALENLSSYETFAASTMSEAQFYSSVVEQSGCSYMLDINNVYVSATNHGFDAHEYLASVNFDKVVQVHLAGHTVEPSGLIIDTHSDHVADEVWDLYRHAWRIGGPFPTLIEWDASIPALDVLVAEAERARQVRQ